VQRINLVIILSSIITIPIYIGQVLVGELFIGPLLFLILSINIFTTSILLFKLYRDETIEYTKFMKLTLVTPFFTYTLILYITILFSVFYPSILVMYQVYYPTAGIAFIMFILIAPVLLSPPNYVKSLKIKSTGSLSMDKKYYENLRAKDYFNADKFI
jgi:hypothetical protein